MYQGRGSFWGFNLNISPVISLLMINPPLVPALRYPPCPNSQFSAALFCLSSSDCAMCFLIPYFRNNRRSPVVPLSGWLLPLSLIDQGSVCWEALEKWRTSGWMDESFSFYWRKWWAKRNVRSCIGSEAKREINEAGTRDRRASKEKYERGKGNRSDRMTNKLLHSWPIFRVLRLWGTCPGFWRRVTYSQAVWNLIRAICHGAGDSRNFRNVDRLEPAYRTSHWHHQTFRGVHSKALLFEGRYDVVTVLSLKWTRDISSDCVTLCSSTWHSDMKQ